MKNRVKKIIIIMCMFTGLCMCIMPAGLSYAAESTTEMSLKEVEEKVTAPINFVSKVLLSAIVAGGSIVLIKALTDLVPAAQGREIQGIIHGIIELIVAGIMIVLPAIINYLT